MEYQIIKSFHIIFMVSYFAGIFYLVRLFVYFEDTKEKSITEQEILQKQYIFMIRRLWNIITVPAFVLMSFFGIFMIYLNPYLLKESWFLVKIFFLILLFIFNFWSWKKIQELKKYQNSDSSLKLRMMNEIATFLLFAIVFIVMLKSVFIENWLKLFLWFILFVIGIILIVKLVNKKK